MKIGLILSLEFGIFQLQSSIEMEVGGILV